jgi:hypothetical protein
MSTLAPKGRPYEAPTLKPLTHAHAREVWFAHLKECSECDRGDLCQLGRRLCEAIESFAIAFLPGVRR